jgi:hypothetical protein
MYLCHATGEGSKGTSLKSKDIDLESTATDITGALLLRFISEVLHFGKQTRLLANGV